MLNSDLQFLFDIAFSRFSLKVSIMRSSLQHIPLRLASSSHGRTGIAFVCSQCREHLSRSRAVQQAACAKSLRNASSSSKSSTFTEKLRSKIWQDKPPGLKDPYSPASSQPKDSSPAIATSDAAAYTPASTWDGLEQIGGASGWCEEAWDREHKFRG